MSLVENTIVVYNLPELFVLKPIPHLVHYGFIVLL